jgi:hypothetical protein
MVEQDGLAYLKALVINDLSHLGPMWHARRSGER